MRLSQRPPIQGHEGGIKTQLAAAAADAAGPDESAVPLSENILLGQPRRAIKRCKDITAASKVKVPTISEWIGRTLRQVIEAHILFCSSGNSDDDRPENNPVQQT